MKKIFFWNKLVPCKQIFDERNLLNDQQDDVKPYMFESAAGSVKSTRKLQLCSVLFCVGTTETAYGGSADTSSIWQVLAVCLLVLI